MSWLFSRALVEEYLAANCSDGALSAQWSETPTPRAYLSPDRMKDFSRLSRYGMTCAPLTDARGAALLTWYRAGFPVKTSALRGGAQALKESAADCGQKWPASLAMFDRDSSSWKTAQLSLLGDSGKSSVTWPRSGMTADGRCWALPMSGRRTAETGSGLWPTPTVCGNHNRKGASEHSGDGLATAVKKWPTPTANDAKNCALPPSQMEWDNLPGALLRSGAQRGGGLNPTWVEWLMGWPLGWTDLEPLATGKSRSAPQPHGGS